MRSIPLILGLLLLPACGPAVDEHLATGVLHLDPRLEDGRSAAEVLAAERRVVRTWTFEHGVGLPDGWTLVHGSLAEEAFHGGLAIRPDLSGKVPPALRLEADLQAHSFNMVEVDVALGVGARADVRWSHANGGPGGLVSAVSYDQPGIQTVHLALSQSTNWIAAISSLALSPSANRRQGFEVAAVRLVHDPVLSGWSPLAEAADVGLVTLGGEGRRAWPVELEQPVEERLVVPTGGRLDLGLARAPGTPLEAIEVSVEVVDESGVRHALAPLDLAPKVTTWTDHRRDLAAFAGQEVRLVLTAHGSRPSPSPRARALLGAPSVTGRLVEDRRPNILLVTLDTLRYDVLGAYQDTAARLGETTTAPELVHTPVLDDLAAGSYLFEQAWSAGNSTQPSHASILTGASIQDHSLFDNYGSLADANRTLAEELRAAGYRTAAVVCQGAISTPAGFGQGFDLFVPADATSGTDGRIAVDLASRWLEQQDGDAPFFLWVHLFDPHTPYLLPDGFVESFGEAVGVPLPDPQTAPPLLPPATQVPPELAFLEGVRSEAYADYLYHVEVAYTDALMGDLLAALEPHHADTLTVVTADHGECLGEHGSYYNHRGLSPETLHVPLMVQLPGQTEGKRVAERVTNRDITPTVIGLLGLADVPPTASSWPWRMPGPRGRTGACGSSTRTACRSASGTTAGTSW